MAVFAASQNCHQLEKLGVTGLLSLPQTSVRMSGPRAKIKLGVLNDSVPLTPDFSSGENEGAFLTWLPVVCLLCIYYSAGCSLPIISYNPCFTNEN